MGHVFSRASIAPGEEENVKVHVVVDPHRVEKVPQAVQDVLIEWAPPTYLDPASGIAAGLDDGVGQRVPQ